MADGVAVDAARFVINDAVVCATTVSGEPLDDGERLARSECWTVGDTILAGSGVGAL